MSQHDVGMPSHETPKEESPFVDNWAYLKTELNWLDRLLVLAVTRQRQETKAINQVAKTAADRATSHWWKGVITFNQTPNYDNCRPPTKPATTVSYARQLQARIQASQNRGIPLGLPWLQEQFRLNTFEKKLILLVLAPEVNRRFGRLYRYLQSSDDYVTDDLPTVDLCLRLLCRNDQEWRQARSQLVAPNSLFEWGLLKWVDPPTMTLLSRRFRLADEVAAYLLSEQPDPTQIQHLTPAAQATEVEAEAEAETETLPPKPAPSFTVSESPEFPWNHLALPHEVMAQLEILAAAKNAESSRLLLLTGEAGTGKTAIARALAHRWEERLTRIDLATLTTTTAPVVLDALTSARGIVLLETAQCWFGRQPRLETAQIEAWVNCCQADLICLSTEYLQSVVPSWRRRCAGVLSLPRPDTAARRQILRQAVPSDISVDKQLRWIQLARQLPLTGGELVKLTEVAIALSQQSRQNLLTANHFRQAATLQHPGLKFKSS